MRFFFIVCIFSTCLSSCTAVKVVDTAASAAIGTASGMVKVTGKVIDAAIPDGKDDKPDE